ncbi:MAG TPA: AmmeMemoRadiSam system protein A [Terriglobales bacterium]|nr:AmmeMemoRadiSam system protein A [Terriglobales bacterium]
MPEYSKDERRQLLALARESITAALDSRKLDLTPPSEHLAEHRGAFTTLHIAGELRGCVGYVFPQYSLYRTVAETSCAAAFDDPRFTPVQKQEVPSLQFEISVLSPLQPIDPEDVEIGVHGLVITYGNRRGLLLPQVPNEHGWDRETFLQQTCLKAGLPSDAWEHGAKVEAFTAEIFSEQDF